MFLRGPAYTRNLYTIGYWWDFRSSLTNVWGCTHSVIISNQDILSTGTDVIVATLKQSGYLQAMLSKDPVGR